MSMDGKGVCVLALITVGALALLFFYFSIESLKQFSKKNLHDKGGGLDSYKEEHLSVLGITPL